MQFTVIAAGCRPGHERLGQTALVQAIHCTRTHQNWGCLLSRSADNGTQSKSLTAISLLTFIVLILVLAATGCGDAGPAAPDDQPVATTTPATTATARPAAEIPATESRVQSLVEPTRVLSSLTGILTEANGCLRVKSDHDAPESRGQALVWQKGIFEVERRADTLVIVDLFGQSGQPSPPVTWRLGDMIRGAGGAIEGPSYGYLDDHAEAGFSDRCAGPYFLISIVR